jgi:hypothetical protein
LRILALLNAKSDIHSARHAKAFAQLQRSNEDIVEAIAFHSSTVASGLHDIAKRVGDLHQEGAAAAEDRHQETTAAILMLRDGATQTIIRSPTTDTNADAGKRRPLNQAMTFRAAGDFPRMNSMGTEPATCTLTDFEPIRHDVLNCLYFGQMTDRQEEVALAHAHTFEWIFRDPAPEHKPWSDFVKWLQYRQGCYWVGGKAGSGKSTLMKYIEQHDTTRTIPEIMGCWT